MLTEIEFSNYAEIHKISPAALEYICSTRDSEASRPVGMYAMNNVCSWVNSETMGHTLSSESRTQERAFIILSEYDERILEIWDQPQPIIIERTNKNGVKRKGSYTPDFLILTTSGPQIIEVKSEDETIKKITMNHPDWEMYEDNKVVYLPAKYWFDNIGLSHQVFCIKPEYRYLIANIQLLLSSRAQEKYAPELLVSAMKVFSQSFCLSLDDLKALLQIEDYTPIIQMIDHQDIVCNLREELLSDPESCYVSTRMDLLMEAKKIRDESKLYRDGFLTDVKAYRVPTLFEAEKAIKRLENATNNVSTRSARRWREKLRSINSSEVSPFQALITNDRSKGNYKPKIHIVVSDYLEKYLTEVHSINQGISTYRSYIQYRVLAESAHSNYPPVSERTFGKRLKKLSESKIGFLRGGRRLANAKSEPTDPTKRSIKPQLPWQSAAIDHYKADIYLVVFENDNELTVIRPWISAMIDLATLKILAITISFRDPSKIVCAKVIRDCVRRHGKLPEEIIVDRGSDFKSVYFEALLANYRVDLSMRPAGHSRFGGEIEGFFGEFKKQWLVYRPGNTADYKEVRSVDGNKRPQRSAVLNPLDFYREMLDFLSWRERKPVGFRSKSISICYEKKCKEYPFVGRTVKYDEEFMIASSVEEVDYAIDFQRGIHIDHLWYWNTELSSCRGRRKIGVRRDPENPHVVYASLKNKWIPCYSSRINTFSAKNNHSQIVEGLELMEANTAKKAAKLRADEEVVRLLRNKDNTAQCRTKIPIIEVSKVVDTAPDGEGSVFDNVDISAVVGLELEFWREQYE